MALVKPTNLKKAAIPEDAPFALVAQNWRNAVASYAIGHNLQIQLESPDSARKALSCGHIVPPLASLEETVRDCFLEDSFDGQLHLMTIRDLSRTLPKIGHPIVALVFWRDLDRDEIYSWVEDVDACRRKLLEEQAGEDIASADVPSPTPPPLDGSKPNDDGDQLSLVVRSQSDVKFNSAFDMSSLAEMLPDYSKKELVEDPYSGWIKIELVGTHPDHLRRGYARLLVVSVLLIAMVRDGKKSAVLQVAGGYKDNDAATALYLSLGFSIPPKGMFKEPNENVLVLWSIGRGLEGLDWRWFAKFGRLRPITADDSTGEERTLDELEDEVKAKAKHAKKQGKKR